MKAFREYFRTPAATGKKVTGLFGIKGLNSAEGLTNFAATSLARAKSLAHDLRSPSFKLQAGPAEIRKLDELSDTLCRVVDLAAFLRIAHPDHKIVEAAQQVHELLFGFMSELNTSRDLFHLVEAALKNSETQGEERIVAQLLKHDFLKNGVQYELDTKRQNKFINLSNDISINGQNFLLGCGDRQVDDLELSPSELKGSSPALLAKLSRIEAASSSIWQGKIRIPASMPHIAEHLLATATNTETRKKVWHHLRSASKQQVERLDGVLKDRHELALLAGYDTFANYELGDKMMINSENVNRFLTSLAHSVKPLASQELQKIGAPVAPWDYNFVLSKYRSQLRKTVSPPSFELTGVFCAINELIQTLFGLRFEPGNILPGEVWDPEVHRLDVFDGDEKVGVVYCDLLSRPGKQPNPAHFTIQCARHLYPSNEKQLPIIALVCDFEKHSRTGTVTMQYGDVQTLFHEMGHAIHSMIGRTRLHNVAGTRCATDFVELPSILFEKFASHPAVLETMKPELDATQFLAKQAKIDAATEYWETWHQLCLSFLDQALHGEPFLKCGSSSMVARQITSQYTLYDKAPLADQHTEQFVHFGHLISYGATYYSYLFDRSLASMTWDLLFQQRSSWDKGGRRFKEQVLHWGGARDPRECINALFGKNVEPSAMAQSLANQL